MMNDECFCFIHTAEWDLIEFSVTSSKSSLSFIVWMVVSGESKKSSAINGKIPH